MYEEVRSRSAARQAVAVLEMVPKTPGFTSTGRSEQVRWQGRGLGALVEPVVGRLVGDAWGARFEPEEQVEDTRTRERALRMPRCSWTQPESACPCGGGLGSW